MLPHIAGRALSLVRLPNGIGQASFYQKNVTTTLPPGFESVPVPDKKTGEIHQYVSLSTPEAIAAMAQMSVLEVHPWGSMADDLERPDRLVIDLDPDESLSWSVLTGAAEDVRKRLKRWASSPSSRPPEGRDCTSSSPSSQKWHTRKSSSGATGSQTQWSAPTQSSTSPT